MTSSHMGREMREQPAVFADLLARAPEQVAAIRAVVPDPLAGVVFVARGSSDNAATLGRYLAELAALRPVALAAPSLHTLYGAQVDHSGHLAVALSQSGATPEINTVIARMRASGAATVAVTNEGGSELASLADVLVDLGAGHEVAVPATKTVTAQMLAMATVAGALAPGGTPRPRLGGLADAAADVLADAAPARALAQRWAAVTRLAVVSRGLGYAAALEGALKIKELTGAQAVGSSSADFRHGPIATLGPDTPLLVVDAGGPAAEDLRALAAAAHERAVPVAWCSADAAADLPLPAGGDELAQVLLATIRMQQLAFELALAHGVDPDSPHGLSKVTETR